MGSPEEDDEQRKPLVKRRKSEKDYGGVKSRSSSTDSATSSKSDNKRKSKDNKKKRKKTVSLCNLFRYSDKLDKLLMFLGSLFAVIQGAGWPLLAIVFGEMTNTFIEQERPADFDLNSEYVESNQSRPNGFLSVNISNNNVVEIPIYQDDVSQPSSIFGNLSPQMFETQMTAFALYYVYIGIVVFGAALLQIYCWQVSCERQVYKMRQEFFYQVLRQEIGWFDKHQSGELAMKLNDDLERIREGIGDKFSMLIQHTSTFMAGFIVGFLKGWELTLVIMSMSPLVALTSAYMGKIVATSSAREQAKYALAGSVAEEVLGNIRTVTSFSGQKREINRYTAALTMGRDIAMKKYVMMGLAMGVTFLILYGTYALAFWYGSELILAKKMDPGGVFTVFFAVMIGSFSLGNAAPHLSAVATAMGSAVTIFEILEMRPNIDPYSDKGLMLDPENLRADIEFNDVRFNYPTRRSVPILRNLSIRIKEGQTVALCGASGSGKSTVIGLLLRFYDPLSGKISINGHNLKSLNVRWLRSVIGVVSQEPILFASTIAENIQYGRQDVTFSEVVEAARMANAHDFISALPKAYDTLVGDRGAQLSGGQKQRIAIARALVRDPKILLLDEATSALDAESEAVVQEALDKAREGRTTIIVAHRLSTIKNADVIYAMEDGQVLEYGSHEELMDKEGLYHNLVMNQMFVDETGYSTTEGAISDNDLVMRKRGRSTSVLSPPVIPEVEKEFYRLMSDVQDEEIPLPSAFKILGFAKREWKEIVLGSFASIITGATMPAFAVFYSEIFNTFTLEGEDLKDAAFFWSMMFLVLAVGTGIGNLLRMIGFGFSGEKLTMRLRRDAFTNIVRQHVGWFDDDKHSYGKIATRLATDVPMVKTAAGHRVGIVISAIVTLGTSIVIAFIFGWKLALALTAAVPILLAAGAVEMRIMKGNQIRDAELMADAGRVVTECLENIRTVQSLTQEPLFLTKFVHHLDLPFTENKKHALVYGLAFAFSQGVIFFIYAAAFRFGAFLIGNGEMVATDVYRVFFAMAFSAVSVGQWTSYLPDYTKAQLSAGLVFHLMETEPVIDAFSNGGIQPRIKGEVTFSDVHFKYPTRSNVPILKGISFTVSPGQTLALIGPSGCGKSTVVSLIQRFYDPERGTVKVDDFDIRTINLAHLRSHVAVVSQEPVLFNCTIGENIIYGLEGEVSQRQIEDAAILANIHDFIVGLPKGYQTMVGERGAQLSGGQKQRIAIARALVRDPRVLLLDEATSALDTESEKIVQEALDKASKGRTCIVVAHRLSTIQNADCIAVVDKGKIVESGKHDELIKKKGVYYKLTKRQRITH